MSEEEESTSTAVAWHLYVIRTRDQKLYAGVTTDVQRRFKEHLSQGRRAARYLRAHKPERLVFSQLIGDQSLALKVEYWFKRLPRQRKERIIRAGQLGVDALTGKTTRATHRARPAPQRKSNNLRLCTKVPASNR